MGTLDRNLRRDLENAVKKARRVAEAGARQAIEQLAVGHNEPWPTLSPEQRKLRNRLRTHGRQLGDTLDERKGTQTIERLAGECAYEHWHRLLFARFLAENDLLVEPESGMALSLDECRELAREQGKDWLVLASDFAQRMLPQIFRADDPVLEVALPPEKRQELEAVLEGLHRDSFLADDSLGWVYQHWQAETKALINQSEQRIGADELPAVTQLFTEDYMVLFLLHNTLGAWWAGKMFAEQPHLARNVETETEVRRALALPGVNWDYLRLRNTGQEWTPVAGVFKEWPGNAKAISLIDPCMGSGHFLIFAFPILVALRMHEENLCREAAVDAVLSENLFGLEVDPRCTQIAAFNLALTAWRAAGYRPLPKLNVACAGLCPSATKEQWLKLCGDDAHIQAEMGRMYELFSHAQELGSLINPRNARGTLFDPRFEEVQPILDRALFASDDATRELAVTASGIARAAQLLASEFTLVATNVPYLVRSKQNTFLQTYTEEYCEDGAQDLATVFLRRCSEFTAPGGTHATVTPQNWLYLNGYSRFRKGLLTDECVHLIAKPGSGATSTASWDVVRALAIISRSERSGDYEIAGIDVSAPDEEGRARGLVELSPVIVTRRKLTAVSGARFAFTDHGSSARLSAFADSYKGICSGDTERFQRCFWEVATIHGSGWSFQQGSINATVAYGGREGIFFWERGCGAFLEAVKARLGESRISAWIRGREAWDRSGVVVRITRELPVSLYQGEIFDNNVAVIVPKKREHLAALWAFCSSKEFNTSVRKLNQKLSVTDDSFVQIPFELERWQAVASDKFPQGLPPPCSDDPTQWLFEGHPKASGQPLQVGVARLLGFLWPRQSGSEFPDCSRLLSDGLSSLADEDGIVCLAPVRGELSAAQRLRRTLTTAYGDEWTSTRQSELLKGGAADCKSLEEWLDEAYFEQHCQLFHQRPFVWQIWDGMKNGFSVLVNYHRLAAPNGGGKRTLEKLIYTYLGDWLDRQRADQKVGAEGADGRIAAAEHLKRELEKILEGEPPYDIFVRWKPLHQQPIGWEPDIDDGVRANIRPFMTAKPLNARGKNACILRAAPKIKWDKDRGKEPAREKADFPWFWGWDESTQDFQGGKEFDGNRWNDLHYSRAAKLAARERDKGGKS